MGNRIAWIVASFRDPYRVFIIDDQPVIIAGLTAVIEKEPDMTVCGSSSSWDAMPSDLRKKHPDLFIIEIFLRDSDGFELLQLLRSHFPASSVLVYSIQDEAYYGERALQSGAKGYLMKSNDLDFILQAIRKLAEGKLFLSNRLRTILFSQAYPEAALSSHGRLRSLTARELQIIQFIGQGRTNEEIAQAMKVQTKTVEAHRSRIKKKLNLKHSTELIHYAVHSVWPKSNATARLQSV